MEFRLSSSVAILAIALAAAPAFFAAPAGAATHVAQASAVGTGQRGIAATCRFKAMRTTRLIDKPKRRAARSRSVRRACLSRLRRSRNRARARQASVMPSPAPLAVGIDGHYAGWTEEEIEDREALNAPVTRHEWDLDNPVSSEEQQMLAAATEIHTRVLALLGGNDIGDATHYRNFVVEFIRYWGPGGTFLGQSPRTRRIALRDHLDRAGERALFRDDDRDRLRRHGSAGPGSGRPARGAGQGDPPQLHLRAEHLLDRHPLRPHPEPELALLRLRRPPLLVRPRPGGRGGQRAVRADRNPARPDDLPRRRVEADRHHRVRRVDRQPAAKSASARRSRPSTCRRC